MKKVLILGSTGMVGHIVHIYLEERGYRVDGIVRNRLDTLKNCKLTELDLESIHDLSRYLAVNHYDIIVNCVGILNAEAEKDQSRALFINGYLPKWLENRFKESNTKIIHISTDCVFSGKVGNYLENDNRDGNTFYDRSKAIGELSNAKDLTFRQSVIGPEIRNNSIGLLDWFLRQETIVHGYSKALWNGISTLELAKGIEQSIRQDLSGIYHLVSEIPTNKCLLLQKFNLCFDRNIQILTDDKTMAQNKILINSRADFNFHVLNYDEMLVELREWMESHSYLYQHYKIH